jgi:hypothetical protein
LKEGPETGPGIWGCLKVKLGVYLRYKFEADLRLFEGNLKVETGGLVGKHSRVEFKGHKRLDSKVVDTIAKSLSMKPHGNG